MEQVHVILIAVLVSSLLWLARAIAASIQLRTFHAKEFLLWISSIVVLGLTMIAAVWCVENFFCKIPSKGFFAEATLLIGVSWTSLGRYIMEWFEYNFILPLPISKDKLFYPAEVELVARFLGIIALIFGVSSIWAVIR
jgi:hypothetical protein